MKRFLIHAGLTVLALAVLAFLVSASGLVRVGASVGHLPPTRWFFEFSMRRSISTHAMGDTVPALDGAERVIRGAAHYRTGCAPCHGAPGESEWRVVGSLTPQAPPLPGEIRKWSPAELHYLVKHGVKMTGMPAWPALERDDEVWDVVAFMLALPDMGAAMYDELSGATLGAALDPAAPGPTAPGRASVAGLPACARCHGFDGTGRDGAFPALAGQTVEYLEASLLAYASGARPSGVMETVAAPLDGRMIRALAEYYAGLAGAETVPGRLDLPPASPSSPADAVLDPDPDPDLALGAAIALGGAPERRVAACAECHGPVDDPRVTGEPGVGAPDVNFPRLAGLSAEYIQGQLSLFRAGTRGGTRFAPIMEMVAGSLSEQESVAVARWYGSLRARAAIRPTGGDPRRP